MRILALCFVLFTILSQTAEAQKSLAILHLDTLPAIDGIIEEQWLKNSIFEYIYAESANNIFWSQKGVLRSWYFSEYVKGYFKNKK